MNILPIIIGAVVGGVLYHGGIRLPVDENKPLAVITVAPTPTPTPTPSKSDVISFIAKTFEPEGTSVAIKAINCFYSESGLRWNAIGVNKSGSKDGGVAQINDVWKMTIDERLDYKQNILKALEIYRRRGNFSAWYAVGCR